MKHFNFLKPLLMALMLVGGVNCAWADNMTTMTGLLGLTDNSSTFGAKASKMVTIAAGESYQYTFVNYNAGASTAQLYHTWFAEIRNTSNSHCGDVRADGGNWVWPDANNGATLTGSYSGNTSTDVSDDPSVWGQAYNGVTVTVTVTRSNDGDIVTVAHTAQTNTVGAVASMTYSGTYTCSGFGNNGVSVILSNENSHQQITKVVYTSDDNGAIYVAPDHTAGAKWGKKYDGTYESTVDAAAEFYNNDGSGDGWYGCAYAKFSFSELPNADYTITDATLTYNTYQNNNSARDDIIYYMNAGFDLDWVNFAGQKDTDLSNTSYRGSSPITVNTGGKGIRTNLTGSVTSFLQIIAASQKYILFQWTGNAGSANLYGNGATDYNAPQLAITYTTETVYTATFTESNSLNPTVTIYSNSERTEDVTNGTLHDETTYYYRAVLEGYTNYEGSFTISGSNPSVNYTMTAKPRYTFTVNAVNSVGGAVIQALYTDDDSYDGKTYYLTFPAYLTGVGNAVTYSKDNSTYGQGFTSATGDATKTISYTAYTGTAYFYEGEDVTGATRYTTDTFRGRSSNGATGVLSEKNITSLDEGVYRITVRSIGKASNTHSVYKTSKSGEKILDVVTSTTGTIGSAIITLESTTDIVADGGYSTSTDNGHGFDYFLIEKIESVPATITSAGWATLYTPYALDFSSLSSSFKAYTATVDGTTVTLTEVSNVPANTGVVLKGAEGSYNIPVITSSETAQGSLTGNASATTTFNAFAGYDLYMLALNAQNKAQFTKVTSGSIAAGKAFLKLSTGAGVKSFNVVFNDIATGVDEIAGSKFQVSGTAIYNVAGQRVSQPTRGLYIKNGKKIIIK